MKLVKLNFTFTFITPSRAAVKGVVYYSEVLLTAGIGCLIALGKLEFFKEGSRMLTLMVAEWSLDLYLDILFFLDRLRLLTFSNRCCIFVNRPVSGVVE